MKKEIIINASKDRSRIAIVEDGELVELYVENPDNVRTIGNIYLGGVQKVMPAIRAAFVNVGQKQDAFLHFSDLTDNAAQLFALAGEDVPGLEAPVLSQAPPKRVGDDEDEPDPEETLEIASGDDEDDKPVSRTRSRSRRRSRGRGRGRGRGKEEEEEQEESKKGLPSVIDLTSPAPKRAPRKPKADDASSKANAPETADAPETKGRDSGSDGEAPKRSRRSRSRKADSGDDAPSGTDEKAADETSEEKPKRSRRSRAKKSEPSTSEDASSTDTEASEEASERPKRTRRRSRAGDACSSDADASSKDADAPKQSESTTRDSDAKAEEKPRARGRKPRRSNTIDLTSPAPSRSRSSSSDDEGSTKDDDAPRGRAGDSDDEGSSSRRRGRRGRSSDTSDASSSDSSESSGRSRRGRAGDSDDGDDAGRSRRGRRTRSANDSGDDQNESETRERSDDTSAKDDAGRSRRGRRSRSDDASSKDDESSSRDDGDSNRSGRGSSRSKDSGSRESGSRDSGRRDSGRSGSGRGGRNGRGGSQRGGGSNANVPSAESLLKRGTRVICKITKEPISTKGPRVSTDISLAGRFLVLVPAADYIAVSKKIESAKERRRLRTLAQSLKPDGFGVIVRTVASGRDAKSLDTDLRLLIDKWSKIQRKLDENPPPPVLLYEDVNMVSSIIRDLFSEDYDRIVVDDPRVYRNVQAYVKAVAPQMLDKVELHRKNQPVYRSYGIERQVEEAFSRRVNMKGGGYLYIETTEAMHVVDVNSGRAGRGKSQKENLIAVNVEAAREIAKQLRLRDLGGIIVVDFIDLRYDRDRRKVTDALKEAFKRDRAVTKLLPMSDFGLVQITRQRLRPSITTQTDDDADGADAARAAGAAEIRQPERDYAPEPEPAPAPAAAPATERAAVDPEQATPEALTQAVRSWLDSYRGQVDEKYKSRPIVVRVHPLLGAYLRRGFPTPLTRWKLTLRGISFRVEDDAAINPLGFDVRDEKSGRSLLSKYSS